MQYPLSGFAFEFVNERFGSRELISIHRVAKELELAAFDALADEFAVTLIALCRSVT
jgi:hypothetical protein